MLTYVQRVSPSTSQLQFRQYSMGPEDSTSNVHTTVILETSVLCTAVVTAVTSVTLGSHPRNVLLVFNIPTFWPRRRESVFLSTALPQELWNLQDDHCSAGTPKANQSRILNYQAVYFGVFFIKFFNKLEQ